MSKVSDTKLGDKEYEKYGQYICLCDNPWCEPIVRTQCHERKYANHKADVRRWMKQESPKL